MYYLFSTVWEWNQAVIYGVYYVHNYNNYEIANKYNGASIFKYS